MNQRYIQLIKEETSRVAKLDQRSIQKKNAEIRTLN